MAHLITRDNENRERVTLGGTSRGETYIIDRNSVYVSAVKTGGMWKTVTGARGVQGMISMTSQKYGADNVVIRTTRLHQILYAIDGARVDCKIICPKHKLYIRNSSGDSAVFTNPTSPDNVYMFDMELLSGSDYPPTALSVTITEVVETY